MVYESELEIQGTNMRECATMMVEEGMKMTEKERNRYTGKVRREGERISDLGSHEALKDKRQNG